MSVSSFKDLLLVVLIDKMVLSVYFPTFCTPQEHKDQFYDDLMCTINSVCQDNLLLLVGDFNAWVGSNHPDFGKGEWSGVRGNHRVGNVTGAGRALLTFCAVNGLTVMNTWYEKKEIYKYTWQHPGSKMWHCIDYILMRQSQRTFVGMYQSSVRLTAGLTTDYCEPRLLRGTGLWWLDNM